MCNCPHSLSLRGKGGGGGKGREGKKRLEKHCTMHDAIVSQRNKWICDGQTLAGKFCCGQEIIHSIFKG
jgi:hypothetical protein